MTVAHPDPVNFKPAFLTELSVQPLLEPQPVLPVVEPVPASTFLPEESALVLEARSLGKPWSDIARMLPDKSMKALKRQYTLLQRPRVRVCK